MMGKATLGVAVFFTLSALLLLFLLVPPKGRTAKEEAGEQLFRVIAVTTLAVAEDCTSTRGVIEGIWGCLGDVPGGYCYHSSCDIQSNPCITPGESYGLERVSHGD